MTNKMTNAQALSMVIALAKATDGFDPEAIAKVENVLNSTLKKNSNRKSSLDLGSALATNVLSLVQGSASGISCKGVREALNDNTITSQKLVPIFKALEEKGVIQSSKVKGVTYYVGVKAE